MTDLEARLDGVDLAHVRVNRGGVDAAVAHHLAVLGLPPRPVRWALDVRAGRAGCTVDRDDTEWMRARARARVIARVAARARGWTPPDVRDATGAAGFWSDVENALAARREGPTTAPNPVHAWLRDALAWESAPVALRALADVRAWQRAIMAMVDAYEDGLGFFWVLRDEIVAVPRPELRIENGALHAAGGPAVRWTGGESFWFWRGLRVPQKAIEAPECLHVSDIHGARNVEVRRVLLERMGYERYIREQRAELVGSDTFGRLWRCPPLPEDSEPLVLVEVLNSTPEPDGTHRRYFLRVPPRTRTAHEAIAWSFGLGPDQYQPRLET